jgi:transposase
VRAIGLDVHRDFCEVAICENGEVRSAGRIATTREQLELFGGSLAPSDRVALEVTGNCWEIARILQRFVGRVVVANPGDTGIRQARAKTDRSDARTLARLLWMGSLESVWMPDDPTRVMRRRLARRFQLVQSRTRAKNEVSAVLIRCLQSRPRISDLFGLKGRAWLAELELPFEERESVDAGLRLITFLDGEIADVERQIAGQALEWREIKRLMTVPGANVIVASTFMAAVGDIHRFPSSRKLVGYLGLDPKVRQSGSAPVAHGHISRQGSSAARHALVEASWSTVRQPGPMRAFYQRVRARRGHQIAIVACARKLAALFWCMLTKGEDYAYAQPSLTAKKLRRLELTAGAPKAAARRRSGRPTTRCATPNAPSPSRPRPPTGETSPTGPPPDQRKQRRARVRHGGTHSKSPRRAKAAWRTTAPDIRASLRQSPAPTKDDPTPSAPTPLDFLSARVLGVGRWRPASPVGPRAGGGLTH